MPTALVVFILRSSRPSGNAKRVFYRHAGPKGPEEVFFTGACFPYRRARACPSPCHRARENSRGTGPRATVGEAGVLISVGREHLLSPGRDQAIPNYRRAVC